MTTTDNILLKQISKRLERLEEYLFDQKDNSSDWITERQAAKEFGYSVDSLRKKRYRGDFTRVLTSESGRKVRYSRKELKSKLNLRVA